jgi:hypothetical protein
MPQECYRDEVVVRRLLLSVARLVPSAATSTDGDVERQLLGSLTCHKSLRLVSHVMHYDQSAVSISLQADSSSLHPQDSSLVQSLLRVLTRAPRNMHWFPAMLSAAEILQVCGTPTNTNDDLADCCIC